MLAASLVLAGLGLCASRVSPNADAIEDPGLRDSAQRALRVWVALEGVGRP